MEPGKTLVILGTAHGSNVAGKQAPGGVFREYRYSREIVQSLKKELEELGLMVVVDIVGETVPQSQSEELRKRCRIVNNLCKSYDCIYVSIHVNAIGKDGKWHDARGWSVYTSKGVTKADALATCIWEAANDILPHDHKHAIRRDMSDGDPDFEAGLYVLNATRCPAVLTENLFMDNQQDVAYLESDDGRKAIIDLHKRGIVKYLNDNGHNIEL